jgi:hypothetical protein
MLTLRLKVHGTQSLATGLQQDMTAVTSSIVDLFHILYNKTILVHSLVIFVMAGTLEHFPWILD